MYCLATSIGNKPGNNGHVKWLIVLWHMMKNCLPHCKEQHILPQCKVISMFGKATEPYVTGSKTGGWQRKRLVSTAISRHP